MLAFRVRFLRGVYEATDYRDASRYQPEWPPHPDRFYSALVAGAFAHEELAYETAKDQWELVPDAQEALEWLARACWTDEGVVQAPHLYVPEVAERLTVEVFVPTNPYQGEVKKKGVDLRIPILRDRQSLRIPGVNVGDGEVYFIWPNDDGERYREVFEKICQRVTYLGRSRSMVEVSVADRVLEANLKPDVLGQYKLRIPGPNRLEELFRSYSRRGGKPLPGVPYGYRIVSAEPAEGKSIFERMFVFAIRTREVILPVTATYRVTDAFRRALIKATEEATGEVPDLVHGHGREPHCAYFALPFVHTKQRYADGTIKGIALAVPEGATVEELVAIAKGLRKLRECGLTIGTLGRWELFESFELPTRPVTLREETWRGPAKEWVTATPMVFGHFPKANKGGEEKVIRESLEFISSRSEGLHELVEEVEAGPFCPLFGTEPSWEYVRDRRSKDRMVKHVRIRFKGPVYGPLVLGASRYFGLGLMYPVREREE